VVPQGGNTGLTGASVPVFDEVILSMRKMNQIRAFDPVNGILSAEAGCILQEIDDYVNDRGFEIPHHIGSRGSCMLGGNLATNVGGSKVVRNKSLRANLVGIEAVLADGTILEDMSAMRKNNSGYDLKQLFVGSEGTLGVMTAAAVTCPIMSRDKHVALIALDTFENCVEVLRLAKSRLGSSLTAVECMDKNATSATTIVSEEGMAGFPLS